MLLGFEGLLFTFNPLVFSEESGWPGAGLCVALQPPAQRGRVVFMAREPAGRLAVAVTGRVAGASVFPLVVNRGAVHPFSKAGNHVLLEDIKPLCTQT